jgi:outer membrane protein assembly factor BamB
MKKVSTKRRVLLSGCFLTFLAVPLIDSAQTTMFRGSSNHNYIVDSKTASPFNQLAWKFDAAAPLRSTVATSADALFFGSSKGVFYSLNKNSGKINWSVAAGYPINSSAASDKGNVFFSDDKQTLWSLNAKTGKVNWKTGLGQSIKYDWAFDYYYSSPALTNGQVFIGSKDGCVYDIDETSGKVKWKFKTEGIVRSSPAVAGNAVYAGDTEGNLFVLNAATGKQIWRFEIVGHSLKNEKFGYDRRAIIASPVVYGNKVIVGGRDGFLYAIDKNSGKQVWRVDHQISWVISSVAIKDNIVVTGTSDGHFVQALDLNTGKQIWKYGTSFIMWSSPCIDGNRVYIGSGYGLLYCLDLKTGRRLDGFQVGEAIFSSPVISGKMLYITADDGFLYALKPNGYSYPTPVTAKRYVFWAAGPSYSAYGADVRVKEYLVENGYTLLDKAKLISLFTKKEIAENSVVVFATDVFPPEVGEGGSKSLIRDYLNRGGKVVVTWINPVLLKVDPKDKSVGFRNYKYADSVLSIKYGPDDVRSYRGDVPAFATAEGIKWGLNGAWAAPLSVPLNQVDIVLGKDETGLASAWVKKFSKAPGSGFVQVWVKQNTTDLNWLCRVAEYGLK